MSSIDFLVRADILFNLTRTNQIFHRKSNGNIFQTYCVLLTQSLSRSANKFKAYYYIYE